MSSESVYTVKPEDKRNYTVCKFGDKAEPMAVYKVFPGERGYLECNCKARVVCRHIKLVVRYIRGDRQLFYVVQNNIRMSKKRSLKVIKK